VKDVFGMKVEHDAKIEAIRTRLLGALAEPGSADAPTAEEAPAAE
jgi:hypothetical protein